MAKWMDGWMGGQMGEAVVYLLPVAVAIFDSPSLPDGTPHCCASAPWKSDRPLSVPYTHCAFIVHFLQACALRTMPGTW